MENFVNIYRNNINYFTLIKVIYISNNATAETTQKVLSGIDSVEVSGYNNIVENRNVGGNENDTFERGNQGGIGERVSSNTRAEGAVQRRFKESAEAFSERSERNKAQTGQRGRVLLRFGNSLMAYTPTEANDSTNGGRTVKLLQGIGINAEFAEGDIETNFNGVTIAHNQALTTDDGKVYVSENATLNDIEIAAHESVHVNDVLGTEAFLNYEAVICEQMNYDSERYFELANLINKSYYNGKYDIESIEFYVKFRREIAAYINQFVVTDLAFATRQFTELFYDWNAVVDASRQFNKDIGADFSKSASLMPKNTDLQSTAESKILSFDEEDTSVPVDKSYEQKVIEESQGIDSSLNSAQRRINKIAEKLGVKVVWDIYGDPREVGNGYYENGVIHLNKRAKAKAMVFAHEYVHYIEKSNLWPNFKKFIENTVAYKNWITAKGNHPDIEQATENYKAQLETAYKKADKEIADTDIVANFMAECLFGGSYDGSTETETETLLSEFAKSDKWYHSLIRFFEKFINLFKGDKIQNEFVKMEETLQKIRRDIQKNPTADKGGRKYSFNENLNQQLQDWLTSGGKKNGSYNGNYFELGTTPNI